MLCHQYLLNSYYILRENWEETVWKVNENCVIHLSSNQSHSQIPLKLQKPKQSNTINTFDLCQIEIVHNAISPFSCRGKTNFSPLHVSFLPFSLFLFLFLFVYSIVSPSVWSIKGCTELIMYTARSLLQWSISKWITRNGCQRNETGNHRKYSRRT